MIRSICLNPVIDRVYFIDNFKAGHLYRDNRPAVYPGGKGINVAKVLALLGEECTIYGYIAGSFGKKLEADLLKMGIKSRLIEISGDTRMTINIIDNGKNGETEILEEGPTADQVAVKSLLAQLTADIVRDDIVICSGALINGAQLNIYQRISEICKAKQGYCFLDTYGEILHASLPGDYFLVKPNLKEFQDYLAIKNEVDDHIIVEAAQKMITNGFINLMISMGQKGAILVNREGVLKAAPPIISHQSTIGSGDASVAGFAAGINRGYKIETAFALAMACGVSNAMHREVGFVDLQEVNDLRSKVNITSC
jgi:tagatose 6-phosphate kinase